MTTAPPLPGLSPLAPTYTAELFAPLHRELLALLRGLSPADWERPTVAGAWRVRDDRWLGPLFDLSVRALPPAYAETAAPEGTAVSLVIAGEARRAWTLVREGGGWNLYDGEPAAPPAATVTAGPAAWKLFYNALSRNAAPAVLAVSGEARLAEPLLRARSVMV